MNEQQKEAEQSEEKRFTRSTIKQAAETNINKSAITDHVRRENHIINWEESKVVAKESDRFARWIREAVVIRKTGKNAVNRSHTYDS